MLKKQDIETIKPYQKHFNTAHSGYIRGVYAKDAEILKTVYEKYNNKKINTHCNSCVLEMCKWFYNEVMESEQSHCSINKYNERYGRKSSDGQQMPTTYDKVEEDMRPTDSGNIESQYNQTNE